MGAEPEPESEGVDLLSELPPVLAVAITKLLTLRQRAVCSCVSETWRKLFFSPAVWEETLLNQEQLEAEGFAPVSGGENARGLAPAEQHRAHEPALPLFVQLRLSCRGQIRRLIVQNLQLKGRERAFLELVHCNAFLRELTVHDCGLRIGEARCGGDKPQGPNRRKFDALATGSPAVGPLYDSMSLTWKRRPNALCDPAAQLAQLPPPAVHPPHPVLGRPRRPRPRAAPEARGPPRRACVACLVLHCLCFD